MTFTNLNEGSGEVVFSNDGIHKFNVVCNSSTGYSIFAYATPLTSESSEYSFPFVSITDYSTYVSSATTSVWTASIEGGDSNLYGTSISDAKIIKRKVEGSNSTGDPFTITYKAYVSPTTPPATYTGSASYILAQNIDTSAPITGSYTITYDAMGGDNTPLPQSGSALNSSLVKLTTDVPEDSGNTFLGWSTTRNDTVAKYKAGDYITITTPELTLYAVWEHPILTMQSFTATECNRLSGNNNSNSTNSNNNTMIALKDTRDGKKYYVKKLADGNCWMMQDLDLDLYVENNNDTTALVAATGRMGTKDKEGNFMAFTNDNTDISNSSWTVSGNNAAYNTQKGAAQTGTSYKWDTYGRNASDNATYEVRSYDENTNTCIAPYETTTSDSNNTESNGHTSECDNGIGTANTQRIGNYYNWPAATAGTGTYLLDGYQIAPDSICPKGWHIPTGPTMNSNGDRISGEFNNMLYAEGLSDMQNPDYSYSIYITNELMQRLTGFTGTGAVNPTASRLNFLRSGSYSNSGSGIINRGANGIYWSSTAYSPERVYHPFFNDMPNLYPGTYSNAKGNGRAVRCLVDETMQSFHSSSLTIGESKILKDERDDKWYVVEKLQDGKVWMMQDLDMDLYVLNSDGETVNSSITASTGGTGIMGTKNGSKYIAFTKDNTDISGDSWTVSGNSRAFRTQKASANEKGTSYYWNYYGCGNNNSWTSDNYISKDSTYCGSNSNPIYEIRSYDGDNNYCMKPFSSKTATETTDEATGTYVVDCASSSNGLSIQNNIGEANTQRIGNYYNAPAATAGTSGSYYSKYSTKNSTYPDSICPKGWHLPYGGDAAATTGTSNYAPGGFGSLLLSEGVITSINTISVSMSTRDVMPYLTGYTSTPTGKHTLSFLRSGFYTSTGGTIYYRGVGSYYWSSIACDSSLAYSLSFYTSYLYPGMGDIIKGFGRAVRCVAD